MRISLGLPLRLTSACVLLVVACNEDAVVGTGFEVPTTSGESGTGTTTVATGETQATTADTTLGEASMGSSEATTAGSSGSSSATTGGICEVDQDCYDDNDCTYDFCGAGSCVNDAMDDVPAPNGQIDGDCRVLLCIDGEAMDVAQDSDLPDDGNVCTDDLCEGGEPMHPFFPAGSPCNGDGVCDGMGSCTECISPDDCDMLPADDECQLRTCEMETCGQTFSDLGTPLTLQTVGDCHLDVCDGAGGVSTDVDDTDIPDDGLECTTDACTGGVESHTPVAPGTPCAAGVCNDSGACVGCNVPADCGGMDTFCRTIICDDGTCGSDDEPAGTALPAADQTDNDCQEVQCNGAGFPQGFADDDDLPLDDGNDCTEEVCNAGNPGHDDLPLDTPCNGGVCDGAGACVECNSDDQCPTPPDCQVAVCVNNACELQPEDPGVACSDDLFCTSNDQCDGSGSCVGGADPCPGADGDSNCSETCDENANACVADDPSGSTCNDGLFCTTNDTCDGSGTCQGGGSPCGDVGDGDGDCSEACNEGTDSCTANDPAGAVCDDGLFCTTASTCNGTGSCTGTGNPCSANVGDADNDCTESCDEASDSCTAPDPMGATCDDGLFCTVTDSCNGVGVCGGTGNPCTANVGDNDSDCSESCNEVANDCSMTDPNGSSCNDGAFCTVTDTCTAGVCGGTGNPCSAFVGDADTDCSESCNEGADNCTSNDPNGSSCNNATFCDGVDTCNGGVCSTHSGNPCSANIGDNDNDCSESCNEASDNCTANDAAGSTCNDGTFCNGADTCNGSNSCNQHAGNPCLAFVGDGDNNCAEACSEVADACTANEPNGTACNDGTYCNGADTCSGGACSTHAGNPCPGADGDNNCSESCNEGADNCTANDPNNSACSDGLFCTSNDHCNAGGTCVGGANPCPGPDGDDDCSETCNETSNNCTANDPAGSPCDVSCFINGTCNATGGCITICP